jgi:hypothetical protein
MLQAQNTLTMKKILPKKCISVLQQ